jgi:hypothetical protein
MHRGESHSLLPDPIASAALDFTFQVERLYAALLRFADSPSNAEPDLGGRLLYIGELDLRGRALMVAGNVAGAASLAATLDPAAQKMAIRDGAADFLVNTVDEALRILKNEIRKCETVAVCVATAPEAVTRELLERGVLPDLLPPLSFSDSPSSDSFGEHVPRIELFPVQTNEVLVSWRVVTAPAQWLPMLDTIAIDCLQTTAGPGSSAGRRWLRLAPRYLGRLAQGLRVLRCEPNVANEFVSRAQSTVGRGEIGVEVQIGVNGDEEVFWIPPPREPGR